jgi:hypothetical protein
MQIREEHVQTKEPPRNGRCDRYRIECVSPLNASRKDRNFSYIDAYLTAVPLVKQLAVVNSLSCSWVSLKPQELHARRASLFARIETNPPSMMYPRITSNITIMAASSVCGFTSPKPSVVNVTTL